MKRELTCTDLIFLRLEEFLSGQMKGHIVIKSNQIMNYASFNLY